MFNANAQKLQKVSCVVMFEGTASHSLQLPSKSLLALVTTGAWELPSPLPHCSSQGRLTAQRADCAESLLGYF